MTIRSISKFVSVAVFSAVIGSAASASTLNVSYQNASVFGTPNLSSTVSISSSGYTGKAQAGAFRLTGSGGFGNFTAFCVDLGKYMSNNNAYSTATASAFGSTVDVYIDRLFTSVYSTVNTAVKGAAFQVALWEIISDTFTGFNLNSGNFTAGSNQAVTAQANAYLAGLSTAGTGGYKISYLNSATSQNVVTVSPVPVPAALGMLGFGLAGLFVAKRRKKA